MTDPMVESVRQSLWRDVLDPWLPACVRPEGFHQYFDRAWAPTGGDDRFVVFQARMTWTSASIAAVNRGSPFPGLARHGLDMLARMTHEPSGALYWEVDGAGRPVGISAKGSRSYGQAFAIYGLTAAARVPGNEEALSAAKRAFAWLERAHHDRRHGGYFEYVRFSGRPVLRSRTMRRHAIGGFKTTNSHIHLFEAFIELYRLWPDPVLRLRIEELIELLTVRWWLEPGRTNGIAGLDCRPIPGTYSCGHDLEIAHLLLAAADALGRPGDPVLLAKAEGLLGTALEEGWDDAEGGFFDPQSQPAAHAEPGKMWWVQAEGLACLAALYAVKPDASRRALLERQWQWISTRQIDPEHGGWFELVGQDGGSIGDTAKGKPWKEIYHEVRAAMVLAKALGAAPETVLIR